MNKKKILVISSRFPYPVIGGDRLRIYKICEELSKSYELTLATLCETKLELTTDVKDDVFTEIHKIYQPRWKSYYNCLLNLFSNKPLQVAYYYNKKMNMLINRLAAENDYILCHLIRTSDYAINLDNPKVLELTDAISLNYSRVRELLGFRSLRGLIYNLEYHRVLAYELNIVNQFSRSILVSNVDSNYLQKSGANKEILCVSSNGVDSALFDGCYNPSANSKLIVFIGNLNSIQNFDAAEWFASNVMPKLLSRDNYKFKVIGRVPENKKMLLEKYEGVIVTGEVDSIVRSCESALVGVCPVRLAAGVQNKVLEYMALGIPAITTKVGLEGIDAQPNEHLYVADTVDDYVNLITGLSLEELHNISNNAKKYVLNNHNWVNKLKPVNDIFENL